MLDKNNDPEELLEDDIEPEVQVKKQPVEQYDAKPTMYAFFVLAMVTMVRSCYVVMKNSIGYAYGFEGLGFQANNPKYMLRAMYPSLVPVFGLVASGLFGTAYACTNVVMS